MARETGIYRRRDSRFWWIDVVIPNGSAYAKALGLKTETKQKRFSPS